MKVIAPAYYNKFACIASVCKHSCCVDWEIDVDEESVARYAVMTHPYAENIRSSIEGEPPRFRLEEGGRCPHLDASGLCKIITECTEVALCQICRDHPRYRNFYHNVVEIGLGFSCEEATRIALYADVGFLVSDSEDMRGAVFFEDYPVELFTDEERCVLNEKKRIISLVKNCSLPIEKRIGLLLPHRPDFEQVKELYLSLEQLDADWEKRLKQLSADDFYRNLEKNADFIERTLFAFIYRHINLESFYSTDTIAAFAALSALIVGAVSRTQDDFADTLRAYSTEIEYSTENTERVLDFLEQMT